MNEPEEMVGTQIGAIYATGSAEVTHHPNCPVCGEVGCEINHTPSEESQ